MDSNSLCSCGSGRKFDKCCKNKKGKERIHVIHSKLEERPVKGIRLEINNNGFRVLDENDEEIKIIQTDITGQHERKDKSEKVLFNIPNIDLNNFNNPDRELLKYDLIYAIDTNTAIINDVSMSITAILCALKVSGDNSNFTYQGSIAPFEWESTLVKKPENFGWAFLVENVKRQMKESKTNPLIAIVVDSDLGNIPKYNQREIPFFDNLYLPENMVFIYASADKGNEYFQNRLIKECDKFAKSSMNELREEMKDIN